MRNIREWIGRERWFVLAVLFLLLNTYGILRLTGRPLGHGGEIRITDVSPDPDRPLTGRDQIRWTFNAGMTDDAGIGIGLPEDPFIFTPHVPGRYHWESPRTLVFVPASEWSPCRRYLADPTKDLIIPEGKTFRSGPAFEFRTEPLRLMEMGQADISPSRELALRLVFNAPVSRASFQGAFSLLGPSGKPVDWHFDGPAAGRTVLIRSRALPPDWDHLSLELKEGMQSTNGPVGLEEAVSRRVEIRDDLALLGLKPRMNSFAGGEIEASFTTALDPGAARNHLSFDPEMNFTVEEMYRYGYRSSLRIRSDFQPGQVYALTLHRGLPARSGSRLAGDVVRNVYFPDRPPSIIFKDRGHYLSPASSCLIPIRTVNLNRFTATVERIFPNNLVQFAMRDTNGYHSYYGEARQGLTAVSGETEIAVSAEPNNPVDTPLPLRPLLGEDPSGAFWVTVKSDEAGEAGHLVVITDTGISVKVSPRGILVWANSLRTLEPVSGARVRVYSRSNQEIGSGLTGDDGLASLRREGPEEPFLVTVTRGADVSFITLGDTRVETVENNQGRSYLRDGYEAYLFTDRGVYRPGEEIRCGAVIRGVDLASPPVFPLTFRLLRPDGKEDRRFTEIPGRAGTAEVKIPLAGYAMTGRYRVECLVPGEDAPIGTVDFAVEEFVPPRIEVTAVQEEGRCRVEDELLFPVRARHLFGAPAAGLPVAGWVEIRPEPFTPEGWPGYLFGDREKEGRTETLTLNSTVLDQEGEADFTVRLANDRNPPASFRAVFGCSVTETGGRTVTAYSARVIDPYPFYIGIRTEESGGYFPAGRPIELQVAAVRPSGEAAPEAPDLEFTASLVTWSTVLKKKEEGSYGYVSERQLQPAGRQVIRLEEGRGAFSYLPDLPGQYLFLLRDPLTGSSTSLTLYAGTPDQEWIAWSMERPERVELSFDRECYLPGEEAVLAIRSPFPGKALVTVESDSVLEERIINLEKNTAEISIPVRAGYAPNVFCTVTVIRAVAPGEVWAAHRAAGGIALPIDVSENRLSLSISAPATARPKTKLAVVLRVTDASGAPAESEVLVAAVDEGICSLTDFPSPDPFAFFLGPRCLGVSLYDIYALLLPEIKETVLGSPAQPGGDGIAETLSRRLNPVTVGRFRPVALWSGWTKTGPDGRVTIEFEIPEFTGELRLMASAVSEGAFGSAVQSVTIKRNLVVRDSLPRFLAPDDTCLMSVRVFNQTGHDGEARIDLSCSGGLLTGKPSKKSTTSSRVLSLPEGSSEETIFAIAAPPNPGSGTVSLSVRMRDEVFQETTALSIRPPAALQSRAAAGMVPPGETALIAVPGEWLSGTVRQELSLSGRPGVQLAGNLTDLLRYPYGCVEQTTSGAFPLLYLADLAEEEMPGSIGPEECRRLVNAGIHRLLSMQTVTGGFGYWPGDSDPYEWGSVYATHFLVEAARAGYEVPDDRLKSATGYLLGLLERSGSSSERDDDRAWRDDRCLKSYACLVLAQAGIPSPGWTARLAEQEERLDQSSRLNVAGALLAEGRREEAQRILAAVSPSMPPEKPETGGCLRSGIRSAAAALSLWMDLDPAHPAVPALIKRLEEACREGNWRTTQEKSLALMALGRYCRYLSRSGEPEGFRAVVNGMPDRKEIDSDKTNGRLVTFSENTDGPIRVENEGPGTVYYSWRMEGVPVSGEVAETNSGISIRRRFLDMEGGEIEAVDLEQGGPVVIEITVDGGGEEIDNLVITDLLPAGLEIENPAFSTSRVWTGKKSTLPVRHADLRDDRLLIFTGSFSGEKTYYYLARAVTPGNYTYPLITAECMYDPAVKSVNGGGRIRVK